MSSNHPTQSVGSATARRGGAGARTFGFGLRSWETLRRRLAEALSVLDDEHFLVLSRKTGHVFVQFACFGHGGIRAEAVSNTSLKGDERLSDDRLRRLRELGWLDPTASVEEARAAGHQDGGDTPNHFRDWPHPAPFGEVAALALVTLHEVFGVPTPARLCYRAGDRRGRRILLPALGINPEPEALDGEQGASAVVWPKNWEELEQAVLAALRGKAKDPTIEPDTDGDIPVRGDSALVLVRVDREEPTIHLRSAILQDVEPSAPLLEALNDLNKERRLATFFAAGSAVWAKSEVDGAPFHAPSLLGALGCFLKHADEVGAALRDRFGGRRAIDTDRPAERPAANERVN